MKFHKRGLLFRSWGAILCTIILVPGDTALSLVAQTTRRPIFASTARFDAASVLPNPPANDSTQTAAELAELNRLQDTRSPAQVAHARHDEVELDIFIFRDVLGEKFTRQALPLTALLSDDLYRDESIIVARAKRYFHRPRPYNFDLTVRPACRTNRSATSYAYPSGHGTTGYLEALILTMIVPEKSDALLARADDYAHSRLVCGVHYATDVAASKSIAYAMISLLINDPQFKKELNDAKAETRRVLGF